MLLIIFSRSGEVSSTPNYIRAHVAGTVTTSMLDVIRPEMRSIKETFPLWLAFHKNWKVMTILSITTWFATPHHHSSPTNKLRAPERKKLWAHSCFWMHAAFMGFCPWKCFPPMSFWRNGTEKPPEGVGNLTFLAKAKPIQKGWRCEDSPMPMKVRAVLETSTTFLVKWKVERNIHHDIHGLVISKFPNELNIFIPATFLAPTNQWSKTPTPVRGRRYDKRPAHPPRPGETQTIRWSGCLLDEELRTWNNPQKIGGEALHHQGTNDTCQSLELIFLMYSNKVLMVEPWNCVFLFCPLLPWDCGLHFWPKHIPKCRKTI